jgi:hypothetical protein
MLLLCFRTDVLLEAITEDDLFYVNNIGNRTEGDQTDWAFFLHETVDWEERRRMVNKFHRISASKTEIICKLANDINRSSKRDPILLFFDSYSDRQHRSLNVSFMQGWVCIELSLFLVMQEIFGRNARMTWTFTDNKGKRHTEAKNLEDMNVFQLVQFLNDPSNVPQYRCHGLRKITKPQLDLIDRIRKERNDIFHEGKQATRRGANSVSRLATSSMWTLMRIAKIDYRARRESYLKAPDVTYGP